MKNIVSAFAVIIGCMIAIVIAYTGIVFYSHAGSQSTTPMVRDDFFFYRTGETKEYTFQPKLFKDYNVAIESAPPFPKQEKFNWSVKYQLYRGKKLIREGYLSEQTRTFENKSDHIKTLDFSSFGILRFLPGTSTLRLTVEKGDTEARKYINAFKVVVRISWYM